MRRHRLRQGVAAGAAVVDKLAAAEVEAAGRSTPLQPVRRT
ncbi:MAG TPA: hypothetical protein VN841_01035 [Bryobacteraceae bacterium]|nr:hypothetical protein [Bryobacteraceae bacterium]